MVKTGEMPNNPAMANRLRELRLRKGWNQQQLADAVCTSVQQISKLERGIIQMPPRWMERLAPPLGVRPAALMDGDVENLPDPQGHREIVDDLDELALLELWRAISDDMRMAVLTLLKTNASLIAAKND